MNCVRLDNKMAENESSYLSFTDLLTVINPKFCVPYPIDLTVVRKLRNLTDNHLVVTDPSETIIFSVKDISSNHHDRYVLLDESNNPLVTLQQKRLTAHKRWKVFRGDNGEPEELIFSTRKSSLVQFHTEVDIFLASNVKEDECNFKVKGCWSERTCSIYIGESSRIMAQVRREHRLQHDVRGKDMFTVAIYPNVDQAFIVSLVVILDETYSDSDSDDEDEADKKDD